MERPLHAEMAEVIFERGIDPTNADKCAIALIHAGYRAKVVAQWIDDAMMMATIRTANHRRRVEDVED